MREGDPRAAATPSQTRCSAARTLRRQAARSTRCASTDEELRDRSTRSSSSPAAPSFYAGMVAKYAIEHWCRIPGRGRARLTSSATATRSSTRTRWWSRSASPARPRTPCMAVRYAREPGRQGARDLQHQRLHRSRASPTRCSTPTPARRSRVASTKALPGADDRLLPARASTWRRLRGHHASATRSTDVLARPRGDARARSRQCWTTPDQVLRAGPQHDATTRSVLFLGRHVGYPVALEGALKLKELAYIHAEGFAAGELKHGPIALIEEGLPVLRASCRPRAAATRLHAKVVSDIQEVRARGARTICHGRGRRRPRSSRTPTTLIRLPKVPVLLQPLVAIRAAAALRLRARHRAWATTSTSRATSPSP